MAVPDVTLERLEDQIGWYDRKSAQNQRWFKTFKALQLIAAAAVPVAAAIGVRAAVLAALGAAVVVLEGLQQLNQYQQNWTAYRSTAEALKHEKYLFLALAGPYAGASAPQRIARRSDRGPDLPGTREVDLRAGGGSARAGTAKLGAQRRNAAARLSSTTTALRGWITS
jgi:hypothetical protein